VQVFRVSSDVNFWFNLRPAWLTDSTTRPHLQVFLVKHFEVPLIEWTGVRPMSDQKSNALQSQTMFFCIRLSRSLAKTEGQKGLIEGIQTSYDLCGRKCPVFVNLLFKI